MRRRQSPHPRRGISTLWLILFLPLLVLLLCIVADIGNVWLARAELERSLESAALAAVQEWGAAGGGSTSTPRQVGQTFASANLVRGNLVTLNANYTAAGPNNENTNITFPPTTANLVFGSITSISPVVVFDPTVMPSCGFGTVLLDASGNANMQANDAWGFNFLAPNATANLTVSKVVLDLRAGGDPDAAFTFGVNPPVISDNAAPNIINGAVVVQNDVFGISNAALTASTIGTVTTWSNSQISFVHDTNVPYILTINFTSFGGDIGFEPGDRIRFGSQITNLGADDGDDVGANSVQATLTFAIGGVDQAPTQVATFFDSNFRGTNTPSTLDPDSVVNSAPYLLPNSPANGNGNDNQSFVVSAGAGGGNDFAVRARARINVNSICSGLFGPIIGQYTINGDATAYYTCSEAVPRIIRVD